MIISASRQLVSLIPVSTMLPGQPADSQLMTCHQVGYMQGIGENQGLVI